MLPSAGAGTLDAEGLLVMEEDGQLRIDKPFGGSETIQPISGQEFDYYLDDPVVIARVEVENDRMPKELFFIPALILLFGIVLIQRRRATQPAF